MSGTDWQKTAETIAILAVTLGIALWKSPKAKRWLGIRLIASADADEHRDVYMQKRIEDLEGNHARLSVVPKVG